MIFALIARTLSGIYLNLWTEVVQKLSSLLLISDQKVKQLDYKDLKQVKPCWKLFNSL